MFSRPHKRVRVRDRSPAVSCRDRGESLTVHRAHGVGHRSERLQLTKSFPERRERRIRRFELPGGLGGTLSVANQK